MKTKIEYISLAKKLSGKSNTSFRWASVWLLSHSSPALCRGLRVQQERMAINAANDALLLAANDPTGYRTCTHRVDGVACVSWDAQRNYLAAEAVRKSHPEAKRARADKHYRALWLRRQNTAITRLLNPPLVTLDQITAAQDSRKDRIAKIAAICADKSIALGKVVAAPEVPKITTGVTINGFGADFARKMGMKNINMSGKDATLYSSRGSSNGVHSAGETEWRNGRPVNYTRAIHDNYVRSFALIRSADTRTVDYIFHETKITITLPDGYTWGEDQGGLRAVHGADDYHVTALEMLAKNAVENIVAKISENAKIRRELAAQRLAEEADMQGVYVCVADSLRGGNCLAGTMSFAQRHNFSPAHHYTAIEIFRQANGDTGRARLAIQAAINRTRIENDRGYAELYDHMLPA
jgi:hypothetical protein